MLSIRRFTTLLAVGVLFVASQAHAVSFIDFGVVAPTTGTISYAGTGVPGDAPLVGSMIEVDNVVGLLTPANNFVLRTCFSCTLDFTTGDFVSTSGGSWFFAPGGTITVTGGLDLSVVPDGDTTDPEDAPAGSILLSGTFIGSPEVSNEGGSFRIAGAAFTDVKDPDLLAFYGFGATTPFTGFFNISFIASGAAPSGFTSSLVTSGDIVNQAATEPGTLVLLGSGLMGFAYLARRQRRS